MNGVHFLTIAQLSPQELESLIQRAIRLKAEFKKGGQHRTLSGKTLGLLFFKASTRTRISFEVAMTQLGGASLSLSAEELQLKRGESLSDTARTLSRYLDGLVIRTASHQEVETWAAEATIPIINGLTDLHHPCQILGDFLTLRERLGSLRGLTVAFIGDGNNVAHSLMEGAALMGFTLRIACPDAYQPDPQIVKSALEVSKQTGAKIEILRDAKEAAQQADVIYTDVWVSMGQEKESENRRVAFIPYQVDQTLLSAAKPTAYVMHCLPAYRGQEITAEVLDGPQSIIWDQAENRLHAQKALLEWLLT